MALIDKYVTPMARLMVILQGMSIAQLRLVLFFAEFLAEKGEEIKHDATTLGHKEMKKEEARLK